PNTFLHPLHRSFSLSLLTYTCRSNSQCLPLIAQEDTCMKGGLFGPTGEGKCSGWHYESCSVGGLWFLVILFGGGGLAVVIVCLCVLCCVCKCCCKKKDAYEDFEYTAPSDDMYEKRAGSHADSGENMTASEQRRYELRKKWGLDTQDE